MIIYVLTGLGMGGAERQVIDLAIQAQKKQHFPYIIALNSKTDENAWAAILNSHGIPFFHLGLQKNIFSFLSALLKFNRIINQIEKESQKQRQQKNTLFLNKGIVIHAHMFHANIFVRIWHFFKKIISWGSAKKSNIYQVICTAHSQNEGGRLRMWLYRLTHFLNDTFTHVSDEAKSSFIKQNIARQNQIITVHNGLDFSASQKITPQRLTNIEEIKAFIQNAEQLINPNFHATASKSNRFKKWLSIGRLAPEKNQIQLISAFAKLILHPKHKYDLLFLIGDGDQYSFLQNKVNELNLNQQVYFLKTRHDVLDWLYCCDAVIFTSKYEGFGLAIAEAIMMDKPLLSTACGGLTHDLPADILIKIDDDQMLMQKMIEIDLIYQQNPYLMNHLQAIIRPYDMVNIYQIWHDLYHANFESKILDQKK
jgi:glycosyltransferase involved in cell wall biosynthesis